MRKIFVFVAFWVQAMTNLNLYGYPVLLKNTFLQVVIQTNCSRRSQSSPPILQTYTESQKPTKKRKLQNDDDLALQEGRSMVLMEIWCKMARAALKNESRQVFKDYETTMMKFKFSMKPDSFIQLAKVMNFNEMDITVMRAMRIIRDPSDDVNIYLSDEQLRNEPMQKMIKQADVIHGLSKHSFFLSKCGTTRGLAIEYDPQMTTMDVKNKAVQFYNVQSYTLKLERLNGEVLKGRTLKKCNVRPGDCIRVVE